MPLVGKVLWWDQHDGNGIVIDPLGNEYYFDSSVLAKPNGRPKSGQYISFELNPQITGTMCACKVRLPEPSRRATLKKAFTKLVEETAL